MRPEQAFLSALPLLSLDPDVERKSRRNALTSGVAAAFPFASPGAIHHSGLGDLGENLVLGLPLGNETEVDPKIFTTYTRWSRWWRTMRRRWSSGSLRLRSCVYRWI